MPRTQPAIFSQQIRALPADVEAIAEFVTARLQDQDWRVADLDRVRDWHGLGRPAWSLTATREMSTARVVLTPAVGRHLQLPNQYSLGAIADTLPGQETDVVQQLVSSLPLTNYEFLSIADDMPLTSVFELSMQSWIPGLTEENGQPLAGFAAVFTIHHQTDFLLLLEKAISLGIDPKLATVIDKQYEYRISSRIDSTIRERLGVKVFRYADLTRAISDHIRRISEAWSRPAMTTWPPTVVLDDGGYVLPELHRNFETYLNLFHGVVEQTQSGIWALQPYEHQLKIPVFSVAESDLKRTVEAHGVAMAAVTNLRNLLPNEKFTGRRAVVVGYGRLGKALADVLRALHFQVSIAETESATRVRAQEDGFECRAVTAELISRNRPQFVFACGGRGCVGPREIDSVSIDTFVISLTSRDYAIDKSHLKAVAQGPLLEGTIGSVYKLHSNGCRVFLVADGFPVNFHHAESMPNRQSDLVMASLLVGAVHLCTGVPPWPPGNDPARANFSLNSGTLLEDFYEA